MGAMRGGSSGRIPVCDIAIRGRCGTRGRAGTLSTHLELRFAVAVERPVALRRLDRKGVDVGADLCNRRQAERDAG